MIRSYFLSLLLFYVCISTGSAQETETPFAVAETRVDLPIPDEGGVGISSIITVPGSAPLESIEVALHIDHPAVEQLRITLTGPGGRRVVLHDRTESSQTPFTPIYETAALAAEPLNAFLGESPQGDWTLHVEDQVPAINGTLAVWGLRLSPASALQAPTPTPISVDAGTFDAVQIFGAEAPVSSAQVADINGDGLDDLLLLSESANLALIHLSQGNDLNELALLVDIPAPQRAHVADMNRDGISDIVFAAQDAFVQSTTLSIYLGNPAGSYAERFSAQVPTALDTLDVLDLNGDEIPDILLGGTPHWMRGVGDGAFFPSQQLIPQIGRQLLATGDLDRNGRRDLLLTLSRGGTSINTDPYVIFNDGDPSFLRRARITLSQSLLQNLLQVFSSSISNADTPQFVLIADSGEVEPTLWLITVQGHDENSLTVEQTLLPAGTLNIPAAPFDLNGDGRDELVFVNDLGVQSYQRGGPGGGTVTELYAQEFIKFALPGDFFSDALSGIALINTNNEIVLLRSTLAQAPTPTPALTATPTPTSALFPPTTPTPTPTATSAVTPIPTSQPTETPTASPPTPTPGPAVSPDLNGDGIVDKRDLLILMRWWGKRVE